MHTYTSFLAAPPRFCFGLWSICIMILFRITDFDIRIRLRPTVVRGEDWVKSHGTDDEGEGSPRVGKGIHWDASAGKPLISSG